jgi:transposase
MARKKDKERLLAEGYYIDQGWTAKQIAAALSVSEKTVGSWVEVGKWKEKRIAKETSPDSLLKSYSELLTGLVDRRLEILNSEDKSSKELKGITDEISKISKAIDTIKKGGSPTLRVYIWCIERFMGGLQAHNPKLFFQLVEYQREHITLMAGELK